MTSSRSHCGFRILILAASMSLLSASCARIGRFVESGDIYHTDTYEKVLEKWSREARIHRGLEVVLIACATFKSEEYRRAYADEYAMARRLTAEERERFVGDQLNAANLGHEFLMASFVPDKEWDDFGQAKSMWRLFLVNDNNERLEPVEVRRLRGQDAVLSHFFPYITPHKSTYVVRFPIDNPGSGQPFIRDTIKSIRLVIASVLGTAEMDWQIENGCEWEPPRPMPGSS